MNLTNEDYTKAAEILLCTVPAIKAVAKVESNGSGFLPSGKPKILFEGHIFHRLTGGRFATTHPTISYSKWTKKFYYGGEKEWLRLEKAMTLDRAAALKAASWGGFQILGENHEACGYNNVEDYVEAMKESEGLQLLAFAKFVQSRQTCLKGLRTLNWAMFARCYNGPSYALNKYDVKMAEAYKEFA